MLVLDLFSGSKSIENTLSKKKYNVISLDIIKEYKPDIITDILKWKYKKLDIIPDFIWASPPCNTFTYISTKTGRVFLTGIAKSKKAKKGDKILYKTLEIIRYFHKKNPYLLFIIENPRAMMRKNPIMKKLPKRTVMYCNYGHDSKKPTDLFTNATFLKLNEFNKCPKGMELIPIHKKKNAYIRGKVPHKLIKTIFNQFESNYQKRKSLTVL